LPKNTRITQEFSEEAETKCTIEYGEDKAVIPDGWEGVDIGDKAIEDYCEILRGCKTVLWNGPMGVFELENFAAGTRAVANTLAEIDATVILGGGDSVTAANKFGVGDKVTFLSTGGGASLELLEGKVLPGVAALTEV